MKSLLFWMALGGGVFWFVSDTTDEKLDLGAVKTSLFELWEQHKEKDFETLQSDLEIKVLEIQKKIKVTQAELINKKDDSLEKVEQVQKDLSQLKASLEETKKALDNLNEAAGAVKENF